MPATYPGRVARPAHLADVQAILFDVFGTVVDWRTTVTAELAHFGRRVGVSADWAAVADAWRAKYQPAMEEVRTGRRRFVVLDTLHRESLEEVLAEHGLHSASGDDLHDLTLAWHRLDPWPDAVRGLSRLRTTFTIGTLSNGNTELLEDLAVHGGLPWDVILGAETAGAYKPQAEVYLRAVEFLDRRPYEVMLVAAHNLDLGAARGLGLRTGFIPRVFEYGPGQQTDLRSEGDWDVVAPDIEHLADTLGCP